MQEQQVVSVLGLDVGGANLKAADARGRARAVRFPLWRHPEKLAGALVELCRPWNPQTIAVTMTGELCDCFPTRRAGVTAILDAVEQAFPNRRIAVWCVDLQFRNPAAARQHPWSVAAANFLAGAAFAERFVKRRSGIYLDLGSTTFDLVPFVEGQAGSTGTTDRERLATGELVYQGVERTPICALLDSIRHRGVVHGVTNEFFATVGDAYLVLGEIDADPTETATADGRPMTFEYSVARLARTIGADAECFDAADARELAQQVADRQSAILSGALQDAVRRLRTDSARPLEVVVAAGQGEWLLERLLVATLPNVERISLASRLHPETSRCACAHAVAVLAESYR